MNYWIPLLFFWFSTSPQTAASEKHFAATAASISRPGTCDDLALLTPFAERWWCEQHSDSQFLNIVSCHLLWMSVFEFDRWHLSMVQVVTGNLRWMEGARVKAHSIVICHCPWSALPIYNTRSVSATGPLKRDSWAIALLKGLLKSEIIYIYNKKKSGHWKRPQCVIYRNNFGDGPWIEFQRRSALMKSNIVWRTSVALGMFGMETVSQGSLLLPVD